MKQQLKKMAKTAPSFYSERLHGGDLLSFEPSENLENSTCTGKKSEAVSPAVAYILLTPLWG